MRREGRSEQISRIGGNAAALSFHFRIGCFFFWVIFYFIFLYCKRGGDLDSDEWLVFNCIPLICGANMVVTETVMNDATATTTGWRTSLKVRLAGVLDGTSSH
jgi:hypothetical protein